MSDFLVGYSFFFIQTDGELSGLPTPSPSPSPSSSPSPTPNHSPYPAPDLLIKDLRGAGLPPHQHQRNHNCNNATEAAVAPLTPTVAPPPSAAEATPAPGVAPPSPGPHLGFVAVVGAGPTPSGILVNGAACSAGGGAVGVASEVSPRPRPHQPLPLPPQPVDVSALDELLQHIQEVAASGSAGIKVLTSCSCGPVPSPHCNHTPCSSSSALFSRGRSQPQTRTHRYNNQQTPTSSFLTPPTALNSTPSSGTPRVGGVSVSRHHSQRHQLVRMGGALPRHHSFHQRGAPPPALPLLARMNSNSSSNGPPPPGGAPPPPPPPPEATAAAAPCSLTRQHSYSGGPHHHQRAPLRPLLLRRTLSLKPQVPPKPLFLPNGAAALEEGGGRGLCIDRLPESQ